MHKFRWTIWVNRPKKSFSRLKNH